MCVGPPLCVRYTKTKSPGTASSDPLRPPGAGRNVRLTHPGPFLLPHALLHSMSQAGHWTGVQHEPLTQPARRSQRVEAVAHSMWRTCSISCTTQPGRESSRKRCRSSTASATGLGACVQGRGRGGDRQGREDQARRTHTRGCTALRKQARQDDDLPLPVPPRGVDPAAGLAPAPVPSPGTAGQLTLPCLRTAPSLPAGGSVSPASGRQRWLSGASGG